MKIKSDPAQSIVYELEQTVKEEESEQQHFTELTTRQKLVLLIVVVGFGFIIYGVTHGWSTSSDLTATFLTMGIYPAWSRIPAGGLPPIYRGCQVLTFGALVVGLRGVLFLVMEAPDNRHHNPCGRTDRYLPAPVHSGRSHACSSVLHQLFYQSGSVRRLRPCQ